LSIITFLSDFGLNDWYTGCVKGVILSINQNIQIIDITHNISPFYIEQVAFIMFNYYDYYPEATVHLAVVDPGVGGERIPLIIRTEKYFFVGPNNGIFSYIIANENYSVYQVEIDKLKKYNPHFISNTFHARDIFGPAAALLTKGILPEELGHIYHQELMLNKTDISIKQDEILAKIVHIDRFGNIISNFSINNYRQMKNRKIKEISLKNILLDGLEKTYSNVRKGKFLALWGSHGFLEISINQGNAAKELKCLCNKDIIKIKLE
jgi:S-adenosylmethionine hydrolase